MYAAFHNKNRTSHKVCAKRESFAGAGPSVSISGSFTDIGTDVERK